MDGINVVRDSKRILLIVYTKSFSLHLKKIISWRLGPVDPSLVYSENSWAVKAQVCFSDQVSERSPQQHYKTAMVVPPAEVTVLNKSRSYNQSPLSPPQTPVLELTWGLGSVWLLEQSWPLRAYQTSESNAVSLIWYRFPGKQNTWVSKMLFNRWYNGE